MMDYIKSKFSGMSTFWGIFMFVWTIFGLIFIFKILKNFSFQIKYVLILLFFVGLFIFSINYLKHIKWIKIKEDKLIYYSILQPFGKTLNITNYIGKIILTESGSAGSYKVVYLVDKQNKTSFKLMGLHYKNFEEIDNAIHLKKINFSPNVSQYFKLLFFEKITVKNDKSSNKSEVTNLILGLFRLICITGIVLFILGSLIKKFL
ncbi:hypothetical protein H5J24_06785 [Chryseobacterium capnotolerans]|uniref:hypothetical protein n=1 Tax=Chryseobacterium TaxID=59732 RepID=UPI00083A0661|nr:MULTISPECIES: hypothetical protein [Chryseobacterium]UHO39758.1 hypothetical protein H5J24_06785 [Chryseobacterium capnotolerans]